MTRGLWTVSPGRSHPRRRRKLRRLRASARSEGRPDPAQHDAPLLAGVEPLSTPHRPGRALQPDKPLQLGRLAARPRGGQRRLPSPRAPLLLEDPPALYSRRAPSRPPPDRARSRSTSARTTASRSLKCSGVGSSVARSSPRGICWSSSSGISPATSRSRGRFASGVGTRPSWFLESAVLSPGGREPSQS